MKFAKLLTYSLVLFFIAFSCTPKVPVVIKEEVKTPPKKEIVDKDLSPCKKFSDSENPEGAKTAHVLYRDYLKQKNWDEGFRLWRKVYEMAPAADGKRDYHYLDGVKFYEHFLDTEKDPTKRKEYIQNIFDLYAEAKKCYPKNISLYDGLKGFKLYYKYTDQADNMEIYKLFKSVMDRDGKKTADFIINPFTALLLDLYLEKKISIEEARKYGKLILKTVDYGVKNAKTKNSKERWDLVKNYAPDRLEAMEGEKGFYDCDYYKTKYAGLYEADPTNCEVVSDVYSKLKWGQCPSNDTLLMKLSAKMKECFSVVTTSPVATCISKLREGDYQGAIDCYSQKAASADIDKKAQYYLLIAKIYYGKLKNFPKARKYARKASSAKPGWGEPYILVGKLYASSGSKCGSGTGFKSQRVVWVALDEWKKAKKDSSTRAEAQKQINKYLQYMPTKENIFLRGLKEGDSYTIPCWINQKTIIRVAK